MNKFEKGIRLVTSKACLVYYFLYSSSCRGNGSGSMRVYVAHFSESGHSDKVHLASIPVSASAGWGQYTAKLEDIAGVCALYFLYKGQGVVDFREFALK